MRCLAPVGDELDVLVDARAVARSRSDRGCADSPADVNGLSIATNHCSVARKMIGVLLRQSCG